MGCGLETASTGDSAGVGARPARETWSSRCHRMSGWLAGSGSPRVSVVQAADLRNRDHLSFGGMFDSAWNRSVAFQRKMSAGFVGARNRPPGLRVNGIGDLTGMAVFQRQHDRLADVEARTADCVEDGLGDVGAGHGLNCIVPCGILKARTEGF